MLNLWAGHRANYDASLTMVALLKFLETSSATENLTFVKEYLVTGTLLSVCDEVAACLSSPTICSPGANEAIQIVSKEAFVVIYASESESQQNLVTPAEKPFIVTVEIVSNRTLATRIFAKLETLFDVPTKMAKIEWWWLGNNKDADSKTLILPPLETTLDAAFYPGMSRHPKQYLQDYVASDACLLLLAGPPGTGKTTLLRHLICDFGLTAYVVYDEELMSGDQIFQQFLFSDSANCLIVEDADTILVDREHGGNKLMARFLNVSDGLIKLPNKKVIFTTNISDFGRIDPALTRPGRCFDLLETRRLSLPEAQAAAKAAGMPIPIERREYALAEIFNGGSGATMRKIGFG